MTSWLWLAVLGHLSNAVVFIIDKALLGTSFKNSATYAALMGSLSFLALLAFPWIKVWPPFFLYPFVLGFGGLFVLALLGFFEALKRGEASRVVPLVGSLVPLFAFAQSYLFLGERWSVTVLAGFFLLIMAIVLLTIAGSKKQAGAKPVFWLALFSSFCFAAASVCGKYLFNYTDFWGAFVSSRVVAGVFGLLIAVLVPVARKDIVSLFTQKQPPALMKPVPWILIGQTCGAIGFFLVTLALAGGSPALVNALQAVQYAAIALVAWVGGAKISRALAEDRSRKTVLSKVFAMICIAIGLGLITA